MNGHYGICMSIFRFGFVQCRRSPWALISTSSNMKWPAEISSIISSGNNRTMYMKSTLYINGTRTGQEGLLRCHDVASGDLLSSYYIYTYLRQRKWLVQRSLPPSSFTVAVEVLLWRMSCLQTQWEMRVFCTYLLSWCMTQYFFKRQQRIKIQHPDIFFPHRSQFCLIADGWQFLPSMTPNMGPQRDL